MTGIPLASIVTFLRPRGALGVLEGAPWFTRYPTGDGSLCPFSLTSAYTSPSAMEMEAGSPNKAMLYLGSGDVCPAAEGWAARVLALAKGYSLTASPYFLHAHDGVVVLLGYAGGDMADLGVWMHPEIRGPAARLATVLRYEMERAK